MLHLYMRPAPTFSFENNGFNADQYDFLPYYIATAVGHVEVGGSEENGNKETIIIRRERGTINGRRGLFMLNTFVKKEQGLQKTHKIDLGFSFIKEQRSVYVYTDYLDWPKSVTKVDHVKRSYFLKDYAREILPGNPVKALKYMMENPGLVRKGEGLMLTGSGWIWLMTWDFGHI